MSRDLLSEATRALQEVASVESDRAAETRARVLATVRRRRARRLVLIKTTLPLAAVLVASAAWASSTGRLQSSLQWLTAMVAPPVASTEAPARVALEEVRARAVAVGRARVAEVEEAVAEVEADALPSPSPSVSPSASLSPSLSAAGLPSARPVSRPAASGREAPPADNDEAAALYAAAHQAHFGARSYSAALSAWDAYLAAAPRGRFATEARYNRAICLARLGRTAEARAALEPFARGSFGAYRQREAQGLLDALGAP